MNVDRATRARAWLSAARDDYRAAERLADELPHLACFHAQQASEKAMKSGDLSAALDAARIDFSDPARRAAAALDKFYVPTRYPDALGWADASRSYTRRDVDTALSDAKLVIDEVATAIA